jgi:polysaccharide biosynthesis transport protein
MPPSPSSDLPAPFQGQGPPPGGAEPSAAYYGEEEEGGLDFRRYLAALLRYKWMVLGLAFVGLGVGIGISRNLKPAFAAQATVQIETPARGGQATGPVRNVPLLESRGWLELMRSFYVLDEVVRRQLLFIETSTPADRALFRGFSLKEQFVPGTYLLRMDPGARRVRLLNESGDLLEEVAAGDSVGLGVGFAWAPPVEGSSRDVRFIVRVPRDAAVRLSDNLSTFLPPEGAVIRIEMRGTDPAQIAATVNSVAERFVEVATEMKRENLTTRTSALREQLATAYADLTEKERALQSFKVNTITETRERGGTQIASGLAETRDPVRDAFFRLRIDRDSTAQERDAIRRAIQSAGDGSGSLAISLGTIPAVRGAAELSAALTDLGTKRAQARQLRVVFAPSHPDVVRVEREIEELETRTIPEQARQLADNLDRRVQQLDARIAASARDMQQIPVRATEEARRERNVDLAASIYSELQSAYEAARLAELSSAPDVRVLDRAVMPTQPLKDVLLMVIAGGLLAGLGLGVVLALLLDRFDRRIRYPEQVSRELGLPILGAIPMVRPDGSGKLDAEQTGHLLEALRSIRMNLGYAHGTSGTLLTTVTSPGAGDGKSFLAANLAKAFASSGRRTLLIDADTRRGLQHRTLGIARKPGLLDYLSGNAAREQIIRSVPAWGIDVIPCGTRMAGGPELLSSPPMAQLILSLRSEYQVILIDSPPIGAGVDPLILAALCGSLVMVLRNGVTDRELAGARLSELDRLPVRVLGAVLNDVRPEGVYRYYSYLPGYRSEDEQAGGEEGGEPPRRRLLGLR